MKVINADEGILLCWHVYLIYTSSTITKRVTIADSM